MCTQQGGTQTQVSSLLWTRGYSCLAGQVRTQDGVPAGWQTDTLQGRSTCEPESCGHGVAPHHKEGPQTHFTSPGGQGKAREPSGLSQHRGSAEELELGQATLTALAPSPAQRQRRQPALRPALAEERHDAEAPLGEGGVPAPECPPAAGSMRLKAKSLKRWRWAGKGRPRPPGPQSAAFGSCHQCGDI